MKNENKYYVYGHYFKETNELFYIGKGCNKRHMVKGMRGSKWYEATKDREWYSVILFSNMTNEVALEKEQNLVEMLKDQLVNTNKSNNKHLDLVELRNCFNYDPASSTGLVWLRDNNSGNPSCKRYKGDPAGCFQTNKGKKSRVTLNIQGKIINVHHVVWFLIHGYLPSKNYVIDHVDGNPYNNRIENLKLTTQLDNSKNKSKQSNNKSGVTGVHKDFKSGIRYARAAINIDGKIVSKCFSEKIHGEAEAFRLACEWRKEQIRLLNEQGAGYTDRHGT